MIQQVYFSDIGTGGYQEIWDFQESLLRKNLAVKANHRIGSNQLAGNSSFLKGQAFSGPGMIFPDQGAPTDDTRHYLLFCEHPPVYTLGKSGKREHILITEEEREQKGVDFIPTNRGGDITFHGPGQLVGYPVLDLEKFDTDLGRYLRRLEEVIIKAIAKYDLKGERSGGETGVWLEPGIAGKERKICAMGIRCSRWVTMHGFALNVNTDLRYFEDIIPCGIKGKQVTSIEKETGLKTNMEEVKKFVKQAFEEVFQVELVNVDLSV